MLAKFKMSLVEGPAAIEKRKQRQATPLRERRAPRSVRRRGYAKSATARSRPSLQRRQQPMPNARRPNKPREKLPNKQNVMRFLRLNRRRRAMSVTPHGRLPRSNGGEATSSNLATKWDQARCCGHLERPALKSRHSYSAATFSGGRLTRRLASRYSTPSSIMLQPINRRRLFRMGRRQQGWRIRNDHWQLVEGSPRYA